VADFSDKCVKLAAVRGRRAVRYNPDRCGRRRTAGDAGGDGRYPLSGGRGGLMERGAVTGSGRRRLQSRVPLRAAFSPPACSGRSVKLHDSARRADGP